MPWCFFFDSSRSYEQLIGDEAALVEAAVEGMGFETDEEYLVLAGIFSQIVRIDGVNVVHRDLVWGDVWLYDERDENNQPYTYFEVSLSAQAEALLPPGMLARIDQEAAATFDDL